MEVKQLYIRKHLSVPNLLAIAGNIFEKLPSPSKRSCTSSLADCLMSGLALFGLKYASLLQFDRDGRYGENKVTENNLQSLYQIAQVPSDTYMRERLDEVEPHWLQKVLDGIFFQLQRGKVMEQYRYYQDYYLVAIDGSGYFSSPEVHCFSCCERHHRDGSVAYYHQLLAAVMVCPGQRTVFPLAIEPILKPDGASKNDCEHNAAKRLLQTLRNSHPHLKMILVVDALYADGPLLKLMKELNFHFIVTAKEKDVSYLFDAYSASKKEEMHEEGPERITHYQYANGLPLNDSYHEFKVNLLELTEEKKGVNHRFCWATDLPLNEHNVEKIGKGGRSRWKIENETFNTLKNQGYQFEHNFGHGYQYLSTVMAYLMFIAFLIDQVQQFCSDFFSKALKRYGSRRSVWERMRSLFFNFWIDTWEQVFEALLNEYRPRITCIVDTS